MVHGMGVRLEINSKKVKTNRYSVEKVEKFRYGYSTKKVKKNKDYTVSSR